MLWSQTGKDLVQSLPAAIDGNPQSDPEVCAIISALGIFPVFLPMRIDFCFSFRTFHHA